MAFPDTDLPIIIKAYIGADPTDAPGSWPTPVDWSSLLIDKDITNVIGRRTGTNTAASGSSTFWLDDSTMSLSTSDLTGTPVSLEVDDVGSSPPHGRFYGYIVDVTTEVIPGVGGHEIVTARVTIGGIMRQRTQGSVPLSALRRAHVKGTLTGGLIAYWPLEDATTGDITPTNPTFDLVGRYPAAPRQPFFPHFALGGGEWSSGAPAGAAASVRLVSARLAFNNDIFPGSSKVSFPTVAGQPLRFAFAFRLADQLPDSPLSAGEFEATLIRTGLNANNVGDWAVRIITSSTGTVFNLNTFHLNSSGVVDHTTTTTITIDVNQWHHLTFTLSSAGGGADTTFRTVLDGTLVHTATVSGVPFADNIDFRSFSVSRDVPGVEHVCHLAIWSGASIPAETAAYEAFAAHAGEMAHDRIERVLGEEDIPYTSTATVSQLCGPQPIADPIAIARDAETVDHGILAEDTSTWGLTYRAGQQRYGQDAAFTIDLATYNVAEGQSRNVLRPVRNDSRLRNEWTISRPTGTSITVRDEDSIAKRGRRSDSATVNLASDYPLNNEASWRVREGVYGGRRWGSVPVDFGENLTLLTAWLDTELGDRIDRTGHALSYLERLDLQGYTERLRRTSWTADLYVEPHSLWGDVMVAADRDSPGTDPSRASHPGSTLTSAINTTVGSAAVTNLPAISWGTDDLPYGLNIDGELVTVTAVSGTGSSQTLTITRSVNGVVKAHAAGTPVQIWRPVHAAL